MIANDRPRILNMLRLRGSFDSYPILARSASAAWSTEPLRLVGAASDRRRTMSAMMEVGFRSQRCDSGVLGDVEILIDSS